MSVSNGVKRFIIIDYQSVFGREFFLLFVLFFKKFMIGVCKVFFFMGRESLGFLYIEVVFFFCIYLLIIVIIILFNLKFL